jgi:ribosome biogenesis GTPase
LEGALELVFADIEAMAGDCHFADCGHNGEPGCAVLAALEEGSLPERRLESWRKLQREARWIAARGDARLRAEERAKWKSIHKSMRNRTRP